MCYLVFFLIFIISNLFFFSSVASYIQFQKGFIHRRGHQFLQKRINEENTWKRGFVETQKNWRRKEKETYYRIKKKRMFWGNNNINEIYMQRKEGNEK